MRQEKEQIIINSTTLSPGKYLTTLRSEKLNFWHHTKKNLHIDPIMFVSVCTEMTKKLNLVHIRSFCTIVSFEFPSKASMHRRTILNMDHIVGKTD